jgi:hypothetical protein|tara:strand:+ start:60 stop:344 length:285 start_codon:yes stop_codon:yes gene_type:complete
MGYWSRHYKRKSLVTNWRIVRHLNAMDEAKFKVQHKGFFGGWITHKMMMGYDGSNYTVWFHTYEEAKEFVDKSVLNNQQALIRLKVDVATIEFL